MSDPRTAADPASCADPAPIGVWLVGARGAISTCVVYGLAGLQRGLVEPVGLITETGPLRDLPLPAFDQLVLGGHDVCRRDLSRSAAELVRGNVLPADLVDQAFQAAGAFEARVRPGILDGPDVGLADLDPESAALGALPPREQVERLRQDWTDFEREAGLSGTVVVNLASTEAAREPRASWESRAALEAALDAGEEQPASVIYAYAALGSGRPFVNFTPNLGSSLPALRQLADEEGVPHAGSDGKTGETLLKTALAPMFAGRALRVLAWQGYNMLGNRDGQVLSDEAHKASKLRNKDEVLRQLLADSPDLHTKVGIDFVPSLGDWKTAWDLVHFEGFLGARMTLSMTWTGSDSALAAPLVLDLVRLCDLARRAGETGALDHTACFFKAPLGGGSHDFHLQLARLMTYAQAHPARARRGGAGT